MILPKGKQTITGYGHFSTNGSFFFLQFVPTLPVESQDIHLWLRYSVFVTEPLCQGFL